MIDIGANAVAGTNVNLENSVQKIQSASLAPNAGAAIDSTSAFAAENPPQKGSKRKPCERIEAIKCICEKLAGICGTSGTFGIPGIPGFDPVNVITARLQTIPTNDSLNFNCGANDRISVSDHMIAILDQLKSKPTDGLFDFYCGTDTCSSDVLIKDCPIRAMAKCINKFSNCGSTNCKKFEAMTKCPFAYKEPFARCDYGFLLYKDENTPKNYSCTEYKYKREKSPINVKSCRNARIIPEKTDIKLDNTPYETTEDFKVGSSGYGMRNYPATTIRQHEGLDLVGKTWLVHSVAPGEIIRARDATGGGWTVTILHPNQAKKSKYKDFFSEYMHMAYPPSLGRKYSENNVIGLTSSTGTKVKCKVKEGYVIYSKCWGAVSECTNSGYYEVIICTDKDVVDVVDVVAKSREPLTKRKIEINGEEKDVTLQFEKVWVPFMPQDGKEPTDIIITKGQVIGIESNTGGDYGDHLHFGISVVHRQNFLNPVKLLKGTPNPPAIHF